MLIWGSRNDTVIGPFIIVRFNILTKLFEVFFVKSVKFWCHPVNRSEHESSILIGLISKQNYAFYNLFLVTWDLLYLFLSKTRFICINYNYSWHIPLKIKIYDIIICQYQILCVVFIKQSSHIASSISYY